MNEFGLLDLIMDDLDLGGPGPAGDAGPSQEGPSTAGPSLDQTPLDQVQTQLAPDQLAQVQSDQTPAGSQAPSETGSLPASRATTPSPGPGHTSGTGSSTSPGYSGRGSKHAQCTRVG